MVSKHYQGQRSERERFIDEHLGGDGKVIDSFIVNKGHPHGLERHCVTENGIIIIYNARTHKLITKKIARPLQITKLYMTQNKSPPKWLLDLAQRHTNMRMNYL